jgi:transcriptional regulator with XRE-family HTH domain
MSSMKEQAAPDVNARIAGRVRDLRAQHDLSLDALAAKSDVSRSMLSLIERAEASPTAAVLDKIAGALGVPLASLFEDAGGTPDPISRSRDRMPWRDPETGYIRRNISPANFPAPLQIVDVVLPAGARVAYDTPAREASIHQQIWVQEGQIEITVGRTMHRLAEDDCFAMDLDGPISFRNPKRTTARYVVVIATSPARVTRR